MGTNTAKSTDRQPEVWTVTQITRRVKNLLETDIGHVYIAGEISNFRVSPAGHSYFTLKDEHSQISAVMFKGKLSRLRFEPENGLEVIINGLVSVYEQRGAYQIICDGMQPKGMGALQLAFEKLKKKLDEEGIFDEVHKKPLPLLPRRIGIVTSPTGAALRDILNVIDRRFANAHIILSPARVQGDEAIPEIVEAIRMLDEWGVDVMIVGRGGGSLEDLWAFNEEPVVRAVYGAKTPIISAVGHEIDFTLCDFAADLRAPTPSAAAELVVQEQEALATKIETFRRRLATAATRSIDSARNTLERLQSSYLFQRPEELVGQLRQQSDELRMNLESAAQTLVEERRRRIQNATRAITLLSPTNQLRRASQDLRERRARLLHAGATMLDHKRAAFHPLVAQLDALSPLAILARGYAVAWKLPKETLVRSAANLKPNDKLKLKFGEGAVTAIVKNIEKGK